jgi:hypothetical protein
MPAHAGIQVCSAACGYVLPNQLFVVIPAYHVHHLRSVSHCSVIIYGGLHRRQVPELAVKSNCKDSARIAGMGKSGA